MIQSMGTCGSMSSAAWCPCASAGVSRGRTVAHRGGGARGTRRVRRAWCCSRVWRRRSGREREWPGCRHGACGVADGGESECEESEKTRARSARGAEELLRGRRRPARMPCYERPGLPAAVSCAAPPTPHAHRRNHLGVPQPSPCKQGSHLGFAECIHTLAAAYSDVHVSSNHYCCETSYYGSCGFRLVSL